MIGFETGRGFPHIDFSDLFAARAADRETLNAQSREQQMQHRLYRLELVCMALWSLLKEHTNLKDDELAKRIRRARYRR